MIRRAGHIVKQFTAWAPDREGGEVKRANKNACLVICFAAIVAAASLGAGQLAAAEERPAQQTDAKTEIPTEPIPTASRKSGPCGYKAAVKTPVPSKTGAAAGDGFIALPVPMDTETQHAIYKMAKDAHVPFTLVMAVIKQESNFNPAARSGSGDSGLMQINDCNAGAAAAAGCTDLFDPLQNAKFGISVLSVLTQKYDITGTGAVLMAYNMGEGNAVKLWKQMIFSSVYSDAVEATEENYRKYIEIERRENGRR